MTDNTGPSSSASRSLPERANLEHLKNQAKTRLGDMRRAQPDAQLSDAQFTLAREYGFPSWRALKAHVDELASRQAAPQNSDRIDPVRSFVEAARTGRVDELRALLDRDPSLIRTAGDAALQHAAWRNRGQSVQLLLERGVDVHQRVGAGEIALHYAAENSDLPVVQLLVDAGSDVNDDGDHHHLGVLGWATCFRMRRDVANYLLSKGARHNVWTATALDDVEALRHLLDREPSLVNGARMSDGDRRRTLLHHAVLKNAAEAVNLLLSRGADVNATDADGRTPLASPGTDPTVLQRLIDAGGRMDILAALSAERYDLAEQILASEPARIKPGGADADALTIAVQHDAYDAAKWLLEHGADPNGKSNLGERGAVPLHHAACKETTEMAELLLSYAADPGIEDDQYHSTPRGWATYVNRPVVAQFFRERGITR